MTSEPIINEGKLFQEFKAAEELHRFEAKNMLAQTAVYLITTGALLNSFFHEEIKSFFQIGISGLGLFIAISYLIIINRCKSHLNGAMKRTKELAALLEFHLYDMEYRPTAKFLKGGNMTLGICILGVLFWTLVIIKILFFKIQ